VAWNTKRQKGRTLETCAGRPKGDEGGGLVGTKARKPSSLGGFALEPNRKKTAKISVGKVRNGGSSHLKKRPGVPFWRKSKASVRGRPSQGFFIKLP